MTIRTIKQHNTVLYSTLKCGTCFRVVMLADILRWILKATESLNRLIQYSTVQYYTSTSTLEWRESKVYSALLKEFGEAPQQGEMREEIIAFQNCPHGLNIGPHENRSRAALEIQHKYTKRMYMYTTLRTIVCLQNRRRRRSGRRRFLRCRRDFTVFSGIYVYRTPRDLIGSDRDSGSNSNRLAGRLGFSHMSQLHISCNTRPPSAEVK